MKIWRHARRHAWTPLAIGTALLALALAGCGATSTPTGAVVPASTATPAPTATSTLPLAPKVSASAAFGACNRPTMPTMPPISPIAQVGDLLVGGLNTSLRYPTNQVPQSAGNAPLQLTASPTGMPVFGGADGGGGYFTVCNNSASQSITLQSVVVRITGFQAFSGPLSAWNGCRDSRYNARTSALASADCQGSNPANEWLHASFPGSASVGATVTASQVQAVAVTQSDPNPYPALPLALKPGQSAVVDIALTAPSTPGTYTFAFGLSVGSATPEYFDASQPTLYAPVSQEWSGRNCMAANMQAQIPAATQDTYYICPPVA